MTIIRIGLDTSKHVFQIHGLREREAGIAAQLRRSESRKFFAQLPPTRSASRRAAPRIHWARLFARLGPRSAADAAAIYQGHVKRGKKRRDRCRGDLRAIADDDGGLWPVKTAEQQAALTSSGWPTC